MKAINEKMQQILKLTLDTNELKSDLLYSIEKVAPGAFEIRVSRCGESSLVESVTKKPLDIKHKLWLEAEIRDFIQIVVETMEDQDFPVPARDLEPLFNDYDCNQEERDLLLRAASSNESYDQWVEDEKRMMSY